MSEKLPNAWEDLQCGIGDFESIVDEQLRIQQGTNAIPYGTTKITKSQWYAIKRDLDKGISDFADDLLMDTIDAYLIGHYSEK